MYPVRASKVLMDKLVAAAAASGGSGHVLNVTSAAGFSAWKGGAVGLGSSGEIDATLCRNN
jgi:hypothetical protein